jgi:hypothetical protein
MMRFHFGPIPESPDFQPEATGWISLREPSVGLFTWLAGAVGIAAGALVIVVWGLTATSGVLVQIKTEPGMAGLMAVAIVLGKVLGMIALLIFVHELVHAAFHPGMGLSSRTVLGAWLSKGLFYAHYDGVTSRNRFLTILVMPFVVLTIGLWLIEVIFRTGWGWFGAWSILNAMFAGGDLLGIALIACQVPANAQLRNQGWKTWWRAPTIQVDPLEEVPAAGSVTESL